VKLKFDVMKDKKLNTYLCGDISFFALLIAFVLFQFNKVSEKLLAFFVVFTAFFYAISLLGKAFVKNNYSKNIFAKSENNGEIFTIPSGGVKKDIDGICVNGNVYKLTDGTKVTVDENGKVRYYSLSALLLNKFRKIDYDKLDDYAKNEWKPLFDCRDK